MKAFKGDWVQIYFIALEPDERAEHLPEDTKKVPLEVRIKGFLMNEEAEINDEVIIKTVIGREVKGKMIEINPVYKHNFGEPIPELLNISNELLSILEEGEE
ncbi:2-amino-4-oxopentanoate thiolase subunit OrtA [Oceanotoga sp. DSM 15011]|jgi:hypothetical protein|uniref:2-amino-4-ketopentanoate thiolase alpha subunit n=1 Tax=Oceanotoga teriensis TaxID=515440 RepID=A0AA45C6D7_9BACT|nr:MULTISPECIES: 2-amino-4-oxopentanoate thiolase subunit OrtA [Oceanotoga]MDN5343769.1 2-amino-4-ketopentanoate thiolase alpha subunit [Oceanotoga sp.]MDO7975992.1 2-amino-4-oxopentanoate thiolase subunit OrtA [Oceanotoga teriensis]PWJ92030.1 hypothetical protein C7380_11023 [Oceanotoga teriensis]UYO99018.1 2-amino-4-oxopentanoate thiolase subunit OrtA [Oceanotoga sp. DSM 15011]